MGGGECREEPPDLPLLELGEWILKHPAGSYFPDADAPVSDGHVIEATAIGVGVGAVAEVVGFPLLGWLHLAYEIFESAARGLELEELPARRREAQLEAWHAYMWEKFWADETQYQSRDAREAAFDRLVGDNASHGIVPVLTKDAESRRQELLNQINDRWLEKMEALNGRTRSLERLAADTPENAAERARYVAQAEYFRKEAAELRRLADTPGARIWVPDGAGGGYEGAVDPKRALEQAADLEKDANALEHRFDDRIHIVQSELESQKAALLDDMRKDVQSVTDFDTNPAHWDLTADQQAMLTCEAPAQTDKPAVGGHHSGHHARPA